MGTYYKSQLMRRKKINGKGLFDSLINAVTSETAKKIATDVATKQLTNVGNKLTEKAVNKIIQPRKKKLPEEAQRIKEKYFGRKDIIPIEKFVKTY